ncbi:hypothetical protein J2Z17_000736 [Rhizobium halophytocola]|uniref:Transposase IS4-like domain-containing protein n=1 Tax=Rhizobium halophytocola TaxID=735519 RepID=A0ABS4DUD7_9HYPH|nr:hypothetical protein [Rhizobium halophytocola]
MPDLAGRLRLPLRQTQGLMRSVVALMGLDVLVPDFSTLSRRSKGMALPPTEPRLGSDGPITLVVDSTGLKLVGAGEWLETKHCAKSSRKRWRKLHLGLDLVSGEIVCSELTTDEIGDPTALPDLLDQIDGSVARFIADGAYDGIKTRDLLAARFGDHVNAVIPPPKNAAASPDAATHPTVRDRHIAEIAKQGRLAWQKSTGYNQRSRIETQMGRWNTVIGPKLQARGLDNQKTEARIGVLVLNTMTELGRPIFERTL